MKEELVKNGRSLWGPFLAGGIIGAGIALLLAPKSGKELRKDIQDVAVKARDTVTDTVKKGKDLYEETSVAVRDAVEAGKMAFKHEKAA